MHPKYYIKGESVSTCGTKSVKHRYRPQHMKVNVTFMPYLFSNGIVLSVASLGEIKHFNASPQACITFQEILPWPGMLMLPAPLSRPVMPLSTILHAVPMLHPFFYSHLKSVSFPWPLSSLGCVREKVPLCLSSTKPFLRASENLWLPKACWFLIASGWCYFDYIRIHT